MTKREELSLSSIRMDEDKRQDVKVKFSPFASNSERCVVLNVPVNMNVIFSIWIFSDNRRREFLVLSMEEEKEIEDEEEPGDGLIFTAFTSPSSSTPTTSSINKKLMSPHSMCLRPRERLGQPNSFDPHCRG
jgi:hypothetical protein